MACMCGDTQCWSCGPAQGNWKCPICGLWADDCCEHIDEETGDIKPEFAEELKLAQAREAAFWDEYVKAFEEE
jgi:hypothetical protein